MPPKNDPIEAAKRTADGSKPPDPVDAPDLPPNSIHEQMKADGKHMSERMKGRAPTQTEFSNPDEVAAIQAAAAALPPEKKPKTQYRVMEKITVVIFGTHVHLKTGMVLDPAGYGGEDGIKTLKSQGVKLEAFEG